MSPHAQQYSHAPAASKISRRKFLAVSGGLAGLTILPSGTLFGQSANDKITVAGIGLGPRGQSLLRNMGNVLEQSDVRFVAIADPRERNREIVRRMVNRHYGNEDCKVYTDMQDIFARDDIDAVIIATGDRWHGTASIMAAHAGKDIYSEKPCSMSIEEACELDDAVLKNKVIFQGGMQRRNVGNFQSAVRIAQAGKLGKLHTLRAGIIMPVIPLPNLPGEPEPDLDVVDWNRWLGPAAERPYNSSYVANSIGWRNYEGFPAGWFLHEWGSHTVDLCQLVMNADHTVPVEYWAEDDALYARYANGVKLVMSEVGFAWKREGGGWLRSPAPEGWHGELGSCPVRFEGDDGWVETGDFMEMAFSDASIASASDLDYERISGGNAVNHLRQFFDSVRSRKLTDSNSTVVRHTEIACHAAAISWKLGRKLKLDVNNMRFINDDEANALRSYQRREPFNI